MNVDKLDHDLQVHHLLLLHHLLIFLKEVISAVSSLEVSSLEEISLVASLKEISAGLVAGLGRKLRSNK
jgi:hypothetical protein